MQQSILIVGSADSFVGHIGDDDLVVASDIDDPDNRTATP